MRRWCATFARRTRREAILGLAPPPTRSKELGRFLRQHREATVPESVGLHPDGNRRTPGLRREELSQLAGVGLSWYTWLEQGREITPSPSVLDALARVLGLEPAERVHLYDLAGVAPGPTAGDYPTEAPEDLRELVAALDPYPAHLIGPRTDVLAINDSAVRFIGMPTEAPDGVSNVLWWLFTDDGLIRETRAETARLTLARFRVEHARRYDDPRFRSLIEALLEASSHFRELWPRHEVMDAQSGVKEVDHPDLGRVVVRHLQSVPTSAPDLRLIQFVPANEETRAKLVG